MAETSASARLGRYIWARTSFDLEGIVGALASWLVGLLLGAIWSPLFWLGFVGAIVILLATRKQTRTSPDIANLVTAPCDGIVQSVTRAVPPTELRLGGAERLRLRISSSPMATNPIYAVMNGEVTSVILEEPDSSVILASEPDIPGLAIAHISYESLGEQVGCTVATGGFGPRLEVLSQIGDPVRAGRVVGKRRLGGWCDVYLDGDARVLVRAGQTLIGGETMLCRLVRSPKPGAQEDTPRHEIGDSASEDAADANGTSVDANEDTPSGAD
jgi:phosphatidylserine decarboxylase